MPDENMHELCRKLDLGEMLTPPEPIYGGLLHKMYKIETGKGTYAVKALNPNIMKRETAIQNFMFSERIARIAYIHNIPAVTTIDSNTPLYEIEGNYYMVFEWVSSNSLLPSEVTSYHCEIMGEILAKIHRIDFMINENKVRARPVLTTTDWNKYTVPEKIWTADFLQIEPLLTKWEKQVNEAFDHMCKCQIIGHRDMDCKNVLWDENNQPLIIDWEAAGSINPLQELTNVALAWSGAETEDFDQERFKTVVESYVQSGGLIVDDISAALHYEFKGKLDWLEYNMKRSLGMESDTIDGQELGTREVINTIKALLNYEKRIPILKDIMIYYASSQG